MKKLKLLLLAATMVFGIGLITAPISSAVTINDAKSFTETGANGSSVSGIFITVANILLFIVGAVAVIMLIIGGFRFVTANGEANAVSSAKNTILYSIIGIVVAFMAFAVVNFLVTQLNSGAKSPSTSKSKSGGGG